MVTLYTVVYQGDVRGAIKISERIFFDGVSADDWGQATTNNAQTYTVVELVPSLIQKTVQTPITQPQSNWHKFLGWLGIKP